TKNKFGIRILFLTMFLISTVFVPVASAETLSEGADDIEVAELGLITSEELNSIIKQIPPTDPHILEKMSENESALRTYGKVPEITTGTEVYKWFNTLDCIRVNLNENKEMKPYFYPAGPLVAYGTHADGYFWIIVDERYDIKNEDFDAIVDLINKQAIKLNIKDVPIIFSTGTPINITSASINQVSTSSVDPYLVYRRPITGGIALTIVNGGSGADGTIGFAAKRNSDNANGYVTTGHTSWFQTGLPSYQPIYGSGNQAGTVSKIGVNTDAAFIPYSNVTARIHTGGGNFVNVAGYYSGGISGMTLTKSGRASGSVTGQYIGVLTGQTIGGHYMDKIELMTTTCTSGDSGGPVYAYYNGNYKIVGIICGWTTVNQSIPATVYIPCGEVTSKLGVTPLTA
ncbi:chymotrypsin family serine protease, partial [Methanosarcina mazei]